MRIVLVSPEFAHNQDGGLANYTYRIAKYLIQRGHTVLVIIPGPETTVFNYEGVAVHQVKFKIRLKKRLLGSPQQPPLNERLMQRSYQVNDYLMELQKTESFDIVQYAHLGGLGYYRIDSAKCVVRLSSSTRLCFESGGYGETESEMFMQEEVENEAMKIMDGVFGPSKVISAYVSNQIDRFIEVIETPFELSRNQIKYASSVTSRPYALYFGSIVKLKGVVTIADALNEFFKLNPEYDFVFTGKIFDHDSGVGFDQFIRAKVADSSKVHFTGPKDQEELTSIINKAAFVVLPSLVDNFPNTCLEAMAQKKVVIGTYNNGFEQLLVHGESGFLIKPGDVHVLMSIMNQVAKLSQEEMNRIGENAHTRVSQFHPDAMVKKLVEYYERVIG